MKSRMRKKRMGQVIPDLRGFGPPPTSATKLPEPAASKVAELRRQVAAAKAAVGDLQVQYEVAKAKYLQTLGELDQRSMAIVNEAAVDLGFDPAKTSFDWVTLAFGPRL